MSFIRKLPKGGYGVNWRDANGKQRQKTFTLKKDAERAKLKIDRERQGKPFGFFELEAKTMTVSELYADWMKHHVEPNLARNTRDGYEAIWRSTLADRIGDLDVRQLTPAYLADLAATLKTAGVGQAAQAKALALLSSMLRRAVVKGLLDSHPMRGAVRVPQPKRTRVVTPPGPEQIWTLADRLDPAGRMLVLLVGFAGLRPEEALGLDWRDVGKRTLNVERVAVHGELVPTTKTGRSRTVELLPALERELVAYRLAQGLPAQGLVLNRAGKPWSDTDYRNWRRRKFKPAAGAIAERPYDLRHAYASLLLHEGRSVVEVAGQLGHSASICLDTYGHVIGELTGARRVKATTAVERARKATADRAADSTLTQRAEGDGGR